MLDVIDHDSHTTPDTAKCLQALVAADEPGVVDPGSCLYRSIIGISAVFKDIPLLRLPSVLTATATMESRHMLEFAINLPLSPMTQT